jgi:hypothetical protein
MRPITAGIGLATVVAGPVLYRLVSEGDLDTTTAVERWAVVAAGCSAGASLIMKIVAGYESERRAAQRLLALEQVLVEHERRAGEERAGEGGRSAAGESGSAR